MIDVTVSDQTMTIVATSGISGSEWVDILSGHGLLGTFLSLDFYGLDPDDGAEIMHYTITRVDTTVEVTA